MLEIIANYTSIMLDTFTAYKQQNMFRIQQPHTYTVVSLILVGTCAHTHTHTYTYTQTLHTYTHVHMYIHTHAHSYTHTYIIQCCNCIMKLFFLLLLNQARASLPAHAWFLKIDPVRTVGMRVRVCACACMSTPEAINNQWRDMNLIPLVKQVLQPSAAGQL